MKIPAKVENHQVVDVQKEINQYKSTLLKWVDNKYNEIDKDYQALQKYLHLAYLLGIVVLSISVVIGLYYKKHKFLWITLSILTLLSTFASIVLKQQVSQLYEKRQLNYNTDKQASDMRQEVFNAFQQKYPKKDPKHINRFKVLGMLQNFMLSTTVENAQKDPKLLFQTRLLYELIDYYAL